MAVSSTSSLNASHDPSRRWHSLRRASHIATTSAPPSLLPSLTAPSCSCKRIEYTLKAFSQSPSNSHANAWRVDDPCFPPSPPPSSPSSSPSSASSETAFSTMPRNISPSPKARYNRASSSHAPGEDAEEEEEEEEEGREDGSEGTEEEDARREDEEEEACFPPFLCLPPPPAPIPCARSNCSSNSSTADW